MGNKSQTWDLPFMEVFDVLGHRFHRDGEGAQEIEETLRKSVGSWFPDGYICRSGVFFREGEESVAFSPKHSPVVKTAGTRSFGDAHCGSLQRRGGWQSWKQYWRFSTVWMVPKSKVCELL